jgi:spermidine synthase
MEPGQNQPAPPSANGAADPTKRSVEIRSGPEHVTALVVHFVFILSGASALVYQLAWQRSLLMIYGSNAESVAMVVSAFMVGLGIGSICGGEISKRAVPLVLFFAGAEVLIGVYGSFSLELFHWVGTYTLKAGTLETGLLSFGLVFLPTLLMGATLPLLVAYRVNATSNVGRSVAGLYFVNTIGAGLGALLAALVFLKRFGLGGSVQLAAICNLCSAAAVLILWLKQRKSP